MTKMEKLKYSKVLIISDNLFLIKAFHELSLRFNGLSVNYACSKSNIALLNDPSLPVKIEIIEVKKNMQLLPGSMILSSLFTANNCFRPN